VRVLVNIDDPAIIETIAPETCDGVGLTRTEFLFQTRLPDEATQLAFYRRLLDWAGGRPVTIRTLDAGGDKPVPGLTLPEDNPFLGVRGVRLSLARPEVFRVQLRALARAAAGAAGRLKVMVPMVTVPAELDRVREMLATEVVALRADGIAAAMPPVGMMVEVPAAALTAEAFAADFYSIGSNDLIQYVTASARDNAAVARLADPRNPAVAELIARTVAAGETRGVEVSLCGDMASSPDLAATLLRAGVRVFSVAPAQVGVVKQAIGAVGAGDG
jgi:phosphotransferase system enzyme I (PtsI)